jgi:hypothetical protein
MIDNNKIFIGAIVLIISLVVLYFVIDYMIDECIKRKSQKIWRKNVKKQLDKLIKDKLNKIEQEKEKIILEKDDDIIDVNQPADMDSYIDPMIQQKFM